MTPSVPLSQAVPGQTVQIDEIADPETATMALRLGLSNGTTVQLISKVPGGPLVIRREGMEIALGRALCDHIHVSPQPTLANQR